MDGKKFLKNFKKNSKKRQLNKDEIDRILKLCKLPQSVSLDIDELMAEQFAKVIVEQFKGKEIVECFIDIFIELVHNKFLKALYDVGTPIGGATCDSAGQKTMQDLLNSFHSSGRKVSVSSDDFKEVLNINKKRGNPGSVIHFKNKTLTKSQIFELQNLFVEVTLKSISSKIIPLTIDISKNLNTGYLPKSIEEAKQMANDDFLWWYNSPTSNFNRLFIGSKRCAIRIYLDIQKVYDKKLNTTIISDEIFKHFLSSKKKQTKSKKQNEIEIVVIPSPTFIGIIDIFLASKGNPSPDDIIDDYLLQKLLADDDFYNIKISGIEGITNYYVVSKPVINLINDIELSEDGKSTKVYFKDSRENFIPISRFLNLCTLNKLSYDTERIDYCEYNSTKIYYETREKVSVTFNIFNGYYYREKKIPVFDSVTKQITYYDYNPFFKIVGENKLKTKLFSFFISEKKYNKSFHDRPVYFETLVLFNEFIGRIEKEIEENNYRNIEEFVPKYFFSNGLSLTSFPLFISEIKKTLFCIVYFEEKIEYKLDINLSYINSQKNITQLDKIINNYFSIPDYDIPEKIRLPEIKSLSNVKQPDQYITVNSTIFFSDYFDEIDDNGNIIKRKPLENFINFLTKNIQDDLKTYSYAETKGVNLIAINSHYLVDPRYSFCNNFIDTNLYGLTSVKNLVTSDLTQILDNSGEIYPEYKLNFSSTLTFSDFTPFTITGLQKLNNGVLSDITFEHVVRRLKKGITSGKESKTVSYSTSMMMAIEPPIGTGFSKIVIKNVNYNVNNENEDLPEIKFENFNSDDIDTNIYKGKYPAVKWIISFFIVKDILFYMKVNYENFIKNKLGKIRDVKLSKRDNFKRFNSFRNN